MGTAPAEFASEIAAAHRAFEPRTSAGDLRPRSNRAAILSTASMTPVMTISRRTRGARSFHVFVAISPSCSAGSPCDQQDEETPTTVLRPFGHARGPGCDVRPSGRRTRTGYSNPLLGGRASAFREGIGCGTPARWGSTCWLSPRPGRAWLRGAGVRWRGRPTLKSSATSRVLYSPLCTWETRCPSWRRVSLGCLPGSLPLALATFIPSRVRRRIRSDSNSATIATTLNTSRPTASVGS